LLGIELGGSALAVWLDSGIPVKVMFRELEWFRSEIFGSVRGVTVLDGQIVCFLFCAKRD
jgi:hypothetical protein